MNSKIYREKLKRVFDLLALDMDQDGEFYNPDKECDSDTMGEIINLVQPLFKSLFEVPPKKELLEMSDRCFQYLISKACTPSRVNVNAEDVDEELRYLVEVHDARLADNRESHRTLKMLKAKLNPPSPDTSEEPESEVRLKNVNDKEV